MSSVRVSPTFVTPVLIGTFAYARTAAPRNGFRSPTASGTVIMPSNGTGKGSRATSIRMGCPFGSGATCAAGQTHQAKFDDSGTRSDRSKSPGSSGRAKPPLLATWTLAFGGKTGD